MNVKNLVLGVGIFFVFMLMLGYGIEAFYPSPKYDEFCKGYNTGSYPVKVGYDSFAANCTFSKALQEQVDNCTLEEGNPIYAYDDQGCTESLKECNFCSKQFNEADKSYSKVVFFISLIVGIVVLFVGYGILSIEPVGSALMASGVGAIIYGSIRNWTNLSDIWRFLLLLVALILLVWITLKLNKERKEVKKKKR